MIRVVFGGGVVVAVAVALVRVRWPPPEPATLASIQEKSSFAALRGRACATRRLVRRRLDLVGDPFAPSSARQRRGCGQESVVAGDPDNSLLFQVLQGAVGHRREDAAGRSAGARRRRVDQIRTGS